MIIKNIFAIVSNKILGDRVNVAYVKNILLIYLIIFTNVADIFCAEKSSYALNRTRLGYKTFVRDIGELHRNLFSRTTLKVFTAFLPFYLAGRLVDKKVNHAFYNHKRHENLHQAPTFFYHLANDGIAVPFFVIAYCAAFSHNYELRETSILFLLSMPFVWAERYVLKLLKTDCFKRPWNGHFSRKNKAFGGFPSGHMLEIIYMTTLFGSRFGAAWAVPLSLYSAFVFLDFAICNRHYVSQLVAGTALGVAFGLAASNVISDKFANFSLDPVCCCNGAKGIRLSYKY